MVHSFVSKRLQGCNNFAMFNSCSKILNTFLQLRWQPIRVQHSQIPPLKWRATLITLNKLETEPFSHKCDVRRIIGNSYSKRMKVSCAVIVFNVHHKQHIFSGQIFALWRPKKIRENWRNSPNF